MKNTATVPTSNQQVRVIGGRNATLVGSTGTVVESQPHGYVRVQLSMGARWLSARNVEILDTPVEDDRFTLVPTSRWPRCPIKSRMTFGELGHILVDFDSACPPALPVLRVADDADGPTAQLIPVVRVSLPCGSCTRGVTSPLVTGVNRGQRPRGVEERDLVPATPRGVRRKTRR